ncbi:MAG: tRNA 2-selenouridine(34) synthase MnmH, partial [Flavobacteriales bacterium]|nr:tRNA 2-selenouridine(34) synthase MnmH [Flavobacteriales bacterium]
IVGLKMLALAKQAEDVAKDGKLGVYCWRGGMRSNRMAWLFEQLGLQCTVLEGGYKAYRNAALDAFTDLQNLIVVAGQTGSGKTEILHSLRDAGEQILDLEGMAGHKGSAFGGIGMNPQPTTQQFQNNLHAELLKLNLEKRIWIERESMTIGKVHLPQSLWNSMNRSVTVSIELPLEIRVNRLVKDYGKASKKALEDSIRKLQQNLGGQMMKATLKLLEEGKLAQVAALLLTYYDKGYLFNRKKYVVKNPIPMSFYKDNAKENAKELINMADQESL